MQVDPHHSGPQPIPPPPHDPNVADALGGGQPPAPPEIEIAPEPEIPKEYRAEKGQVAWSAFKLFCVVLASPVYLPLASIFVIGWTATSFIDSITDSEGKLSTVKKDVKDVLHKVFKPYTRQWDSMIGGIAGVTGKAYRMMKKQNP
ncbi:MAG: hypothetical protein JSR37_00440 [Verrucomicrobia bacterium]|nr:hypothetical protein [Verrucomicrobiota bacterium]MBS0637627.1 hypothetical protein [Verrucomicrobiota bacterium]